MAAFVFSTITAAQALAITGADTLTLDLAVGSATTVLFTSAEQTTIEAGGRSVVFGAAVAAATKTFASGGTLFIGTPAADQGTTGAGGDALYGGAGADTLSGGDGANLFQGNQGNDSMSGGAAFDIFYGGQDNDRIAVGASATGGGNNFAQGNRGDDTIGGSTVDDDLLLGGQGNDLINLTDPGPPRDLGLLDQRMGFSGGGNDFLNGNLGNDTVFAGEGNDTILGEDGDDFLQDSGGSNAMTGGGGNDTIIARGSTTIDGGIGNDVVGLDTGAFVITLGDGDDLCTPLDLRDTDRATIDGGAGNDAIESSAGTDTITGGLGNDTIDGRGGADTVAGGAGADLFQFFDGAAFTAVAAIDRIVDWAAEDRLFFANGDNTPTGPGTAANYAESTQADYAAALAFANGQIGAGTINYVSVQVGADLYVFADSAGNDGVADSAVMLVGRGLADIAFGNFDG